MSVRHMPTPSSSALLVLGCALLVGRAAAQTPSTDPTAWSVGVLAAISGSARRTTPSNFRVYSGVGIEAGVERRFGPHLAAALSLRTESREVDSLSASGPRQRLGSLEFLPVTLLLRYRSRPADRWRADIAAGVMAVVAWEKSGALDTLAITPTVGLTAALGTEFTLTPGVAARLEARSSYQRPHLEHGKARLATFEIDPFTLLAGVTIRPRP